MSSPVRILAAATAVLAATGVVLVPTTTADEPELVSVYVPTTTSTSTTSTSTTTTSTTTTRPPPPVRTLSSDGIRERIAACEGWPRYVHADHGPRSTASGKYGFLDSTWNGYGGYGRAMHAPEAVQDAAFDELFARAGTRPWNASAHCWRR